jgi:hypothetical protein
VPAAGPGDFIVRPVGAIAVEVGYEDAASCGAIMG